MKNEFNLQEVEKNTILAALKKANGHRLETAKLLGIPERTLYRKITEYNLKVGWSKKGYINICGLEDRQEKAPKFKVTQQVGHVLDPSFVGIIFEVRLREKDIFYTVTRFLDGKLETVCCTEYELCLVENNAIGFGKSK